MVVTEIWIYPLGDETKKRLIGRIEITNDVNATIQDRSVGDYTVRLFKTEEFAHRPGIWKQGVFRNFPRLRLGPYDLLTRALMAVVGMRR